MVSDIESSQDDERHKPALDMRLTSHRRWRLDARLAHSLRVAFVAALLVATVYATAAIVFDVVDSSHLLAQVDTHLSERLKDVGLHGAVAAAPNEADDDHDIEAAPVILWRVDANDHTVALSDGAPALVPGSWSRSGEPTTVELGRSSFRLRAVKSRGGGWLVAGQSLTETTHVENVLTTAEIIAGPFVVLALFLAALVIGIKASGPVEQARRKQLEFTADASHELRTPLSVVEAEVELALNSPESNANGMNDARYRSALERVGRESHRLRKIVEDLLWLARFDSEPPRPIEEPVDLATLAEVCADRFSSLAVAKSVEISVGRNGPDHAWISAPPELIDRLLGVLVDNACKYAGNGGKVGITVSTTGNKVSLEVRDSGPGIAIEERTRLFNRFHRATDAASGAGLGLAIADAVVRSTGGRWRIERAPEGGALMEISWHRSQVREPVRPPGTNHRQRRVGDIAPKMTAENKEFGGSPSARKEGAAPIK